MDPVVFVRHMHGVGPRVPHGIEPAHGGIAGGRRVLNHPPRGILQPVHGTRPHDDAFQRRRRMVVSVRTLIVKHGGPRHRETTQPGRILHLNRALPRAAPPRSEKTPGFRAPVITEAHAQFQGPSNLVSAPNRHILDRHIEVGDAEGISRTAPLGTAPAKRPEIPRHDHVAAVFDLRPRHAGRIVRRVLQFHLDIGCRFGGKRRIGDAVGHIVIARERGPVPVRARRLIVQPDRERLPAGRHVPRERSARAIVEPYPLEAQVAGVIAKAHNVVADDFRVRGQPGFVGCRPDQMRRAVAVGTHGRREPGKAHHHLLCHDDRMRARRKGREQCEHGEQIQVSADHGSFPPFFGEWITMRTASLERSGSRPMHTSGPSFNPSPSVSLISGSVPSSSSATSSNPSLSSS
ncbi:MAG: hypothetical protein BWY59_00098 [Verrucomicrobia bacterium ADurb.Bin345]|nr:MAG: hypothetical protein BWY59_00098 [Verrucomicrobia bacterium ADurb.Bin345]